MFLPYKVDVPMARWPIANWVLIGITAIISVAMFIPLEQWVDDPGAAPVVDAFLLQPGNFHVSQLVGNLFIHGGFWHLVGNMLFLFVFGNAVNAKLGHVKYVVLYLGVGIAESITWMLVGPRMPSLGASGAIMGVIGAFLLLYPLNEVTIGYFFTFFYTGTFDLSAYWLIGIYVAFDVWGLISSGHSGVAYLSHVVGFAVGAAATAGLLWWKMLEPDRGERSLLQVWGMMPVAKEEMEPVGDGYLRGRPSANRGKTVTVGPAPAARRRPQDKGPISLD